MRLGLDRARIRAWFEVKVKVRSLYKVIGSEQITSYHMVLVVLVYHVNLSEC